MLDMDATEPDMTEIETRVKPFLMFPYPVFFSAMSLVRIRMTAIARAIPIP